MSAPRLLRSPPASARRRRSQQGPACGPCPHPAAGAQPADQQVHLIYAPRPGPVLPQGQARWRPTVLFKTPARMAGSRVLSAVDGPSSLEPEGDQKILRVTLPLGMQLVPRTTRVSSTTIRRPEPPIYSASPMGACRELRSDGPGAAGHMKRGPESRVQAINSNGGAAADAAAASCPNSAKPIMPSTDPRYSRGNPEELQEELQTRPKTAQ